MKRKLTIGERVVRVDAHSSINVLICATLQGQILLASLQNALQQIQNRHPMLRTSIAEDEQGIPHYFFNNSSAPIVVETIIRTTNNQWQSVANTACNIPFCDNEKVMTRLYWLKGEALHELMLVCPHSICDGLSIANLLRELLLVLDNPLLQLETYPPITDIKNLFVGEKKISILKKTLALFYSKIAYAFFVRKPVKKYHQGESFFLQWSIEKTETANITKNCMAKNTSVHAALAVAFMQAWQGIKGNNAKQKIICPVDIRLKLKSIRRDEMFAFAPIVHLSLTGQSKVGFWKKTIALQNELTKKVAALNVHEMLVLGEYFQPITNHFINQLKTASSNHDFTFSNMGRLKVQEHYSNFSVKDVSSPLGGFPWRNPNTVLCSVFAGKLHFSFLSNTAALSKKTAMAIKEKAMQILQNEMPPYKNEK